MNENAIVVEQFAYDLWANTRWLEAVEGVESPSRYLEILEHVTFATDIWLRRVTLDVRPLEGTLAERLVAVNALWSAFVETADLNQMIDYTNLSGQPFRSQLRPIVLHVLNHATYHRGQMRGLAGSQGWENLPETDYIGFVREFKLHQ